MVRFTNGSHCLEVAVLYRPPPSDRNKFTTEQFFTEFPEFINEFMLGNSIKVVIGDINFHLDNPENRDARQFMDCLDSVSAVQLVADPTQISGHTLDIFVVHSEDSHKVKVSVGDLVSDHHIVIGQLNFPRPARIKREIACRKYRSISIDNFKSDISSVITSFPVGDVDTSADAYNTILGNLLDKHAPEKCRTVVVRANQEWYTSSLLLAKRQRRKAESDWRASDPSDKDKFYAVYKAAKHSYDDLLETAKSNFYNEEILGCGHDTKSVQKVVDKLLYRCEEKKLPSSVTDEDLANRFSVFFKDKTDKIRKDLPVIDNPVQVDLPRPSSQFSEFSPVTEDYVRKLIMSSPTKSCNLDPVPTWLLKDCIDELLPPITSLINDSLSTGRFPNSMKCATVTPILKKSNMNPEVLKNYRPVSNLPFISKTIERVAAAQLTQYMTDNNLHEVYQSAYKQYHSTETALLKIQNDVLCDIDQGNPVILVLLDLSAAFDLIEHSILLDRMENVLGIKGVALDWFKSYLDGRSQKVKIGKSFSLAEFLMYCVPQGSVLGPILFLIFILPLAVLIRKRGMIVHGYADDTQTYLKISPIGSIVSTVCLIEQCLMDVYKWFSQNMLKLNPDKTEVTVLGTKHLLSKISITELKVGPSTVKVTCEPVSNLGALFDPIMSLKPHVEKIVKSANYQLRNIRRIRRYLTFEAARNVVVALVLSKLDYCNSLLSGLPDKVLRKLELVQNAAAQVIYKLSRYAHVTHLYKELHWLPINPRIVYKVNLIVFKILHGLAPAYLVDLVTVRVVQGRLRSAIDPVRLEVDVPRLEGHGARAFSFYAPNAWNSLPRDIRGIDSIDVFKSKLKTYLFKKAFINC